MLSKILPLEDTPQQNIQRRRKTTRFSSALYQYLQKNSVKVYQMYGNLVTNVFFLFCFFVFLGSKKLELFKILLPQ